MQHGDDGQVPGEPGSPPWREGLPSAPTPVSMNSGPSRASAAANSVGSSPSLTPASLPSASTAATPAHQGQILYSDYESIRQYLSSYLIALAENVPYTPASASLSFAARVARSSPQRASAQEKMSRLPAQPFLDLATNVIDEMNRRIMDNPDVPFLPVRPDLDMRKNQARQKLGTLPTARFKDLACDVLFEIERRYPDHPSLFESRHGNSRQGVSKAASNGDGAPADAMARMQHGFEKFTDELKDRDAELSFLRPEVEALRRQNSELKSEVEALRGAQEDLRQEHMLLEEEYKEQMALASEMRGEATRLSEELRTLTAKSEEMIQERARLQTAIEKITEDTENYERALSSGESPPMPAADQARLFDLKGRLSDTLQQLMVSAKAHATTALQLQQQGGAAPQPPASVQDVESASETLTTVILELTALVNNGQHAQNSRRRGSAAANAYSSGGSPSVQTGQPAPVGASAVGQISSVPALEAHELKAYLEQKTDSIVNAIQTLLVAMKAPTLEADALVQMSKNVTGLVGTVVQVATRTLGRPSAGRIREDGERAARDLANANAGLESLVAGISPTSPQSAQVRQKLASSSYEIAKYIKELIRAVD
ncbi:hypothetical protein HK405_003806 [Cladochytrium tenue]|nr:hypothetical protein HK405_003806 [Cladochytrium tenue]